MDIETQLAQYAAKLQVASMKARIWSVCAIAAIWLVFPVAVANFIRPQFGVKVQGAFLSQPQVACVIVFLLAIQLSNTIGFYRRAALAGQWVCMPTLWPIAAIATGVIGNMVWWIWTGYFDAVGYFIGFSSAGGTIVCELICELLGRKFVYGDTKNSFDELKDTWSSPGGILNGLFG
jgi:hypothetical protein